jgi:hypothetical protein
VEGEDVGGLPGGGSDVAHLFEQFVEDDCAFVGAGEEGVGDDAVLVCREFVFRFEGCNGVLYFVEGDVAFRDGRRRRGIYVVAFVLEDVRWEGGAD